MGKDALSPLPELNLQYADFAVWQRQWLQGEALERQLDYWRRALDGAPPVLDLPIDRPRPAVRSARGAHRSFALSPGLAAEVSGLARREGTTLFAALLAGFQVLLARWSGQEDVVVGSPVANRNRLETEPLIGFFVNTLVLRLDLAGDPGFRGALRRVREAVLGASEHQDLPFEKLVEELAPARDGRSTPLFQVLFALQNAAPGTLRFPGLAMEPVETESGLAKFDLLLAIAEAGEGLSATFEYSVDLFEAATIERLADRFNGLLQSVVADPERRVSELPVLSAAERRQVLLTWNETATGYPRNTTLPELFAFWAGRTPAAEALRFGAEVLTYGELDARSNQLACHLQSLGVAPGGLVGVCLERSPELVVTLLAVVKAGAAYLPLDPAYPAERRAWMLEDAGASAVVTRESLEADAGRIASLDGDEPVRQGSTDSLAYVMYTSGSTGRPKGIAIPQRAIVRLLFATDYVELGPADRIAHLSNVSFDAATFEIWGALLHGGCLVGIARDVALSPRELAAELGRQRISAMFLTTALFNQVAREAPEGFRGLRHLLFGGEACDPRWVREVLAKGAPERLLHVYGPTESTTFALWHRVESVPEGAATVPIGRPLANTTAYVLDRRLQPAVPGAPGELFLGGDGLADGYWRRPELTAERFVPNPFARSAAEAGSRLYRTGDLVRHRPDGSVEFMGRADHQVKIRGFRIEPGEIEAALATHPAVREAVVVARENGPGGRRLVAYVASTETSARELRAFLAERLPDYMVPAAFVVLPALPLTPNGKVDRRALPDPEAPAGDAGAYVAPRDREEEILAGLWSEVLGVPRVGAHDDFFELGGHSLLATQLVSRVRQAFGREVALAALFERPTVAGLAGLLRPEDQPAAVWLQAPRIVAAPRTGELPLSFAQERLWFLDQLEPGGSAYNVPAPVRLRGRLDRAALAASLREVVRRHEALRTTFPEVEGRPVQHVAPAPALALPVVDLADLPAAARDGEVRRLVLQDARRPFDLARGPLLRTALAAVRRRRCRAAAQPASHRGRRLVDRGAGERARGALHRRPGGPAVAPTRAARAVWGLRPLAARVAPGRGPGG